MRAALRASSVATALDLHTDEDELQAEVETTLVLAAHVRGRRRGATLLDAGSTISRVRSDRWSLEGARARSRCAPRGGRCRDRTGGVLMLLPEAYVQMAMKGYPLQAPTTHSRAFLCAQSLLVLADADALPMRLAKASSRASTTPRLRALWQAAVDSQRRNGARGARGGVAARRRAQGGRAAAHPPAAARRRPGERARRAVPWAARAGTASARTVYYTSTSSDDGLSGLRVRWTRRAAAPHLPTLDVDSGEGGTQLAYETFV